MNHAHESRSWAEPALVLVMAFCGGAQLAYVLQALAGGDYFGLDLPAKLATLAVLLAGAGYLLRHERRRAFASRWRARAAAPHAAPQPPPLEPEPEEPPRPGAPAPTLRLDLETPLGRGPVWPPGEPLPVTVRVSGAGPEGMAELDLELELQHSGGRERARVPLRGSVAVLSQTVPSPGPFKLTARALRHGEPVAEASVQGRASSYREEVGRRFEQLKASVGRAGLPVGPDATPREVQETLARRFPGLAPRLDGLAGVLETALYSPDEVGRDTYEALVRALGELERRGLEAAPHA